MTSGRDYTTPADCSNYSVCEPAAGESCCGLGALDVTKTDWEPVLVELVNRGQNG